MSPLISCQTCAQLLPPLAHLQQQPTDRPTACTVSCSPPKCTLAVCGQWSVSRSRVHSATVHGPRVWAHSSSSLGVGLHNSCMPTYGPEALSVSGPHVFPTTAQPSVLAYLGGLHPTNALAGWRGAICPR